MCVDHALDEAQVIGHQLFAVVHDEDALDVEVDPGLALTHEQIERRRRRNEQQRLVFESTFGLHRDDLERLVPGVADVLVELLVLVLGHLVLGASPQRLHRVDRLGLDGDLGLLALGRRRRTSDIHADRPRDEVGVLLDQFLDLPFRRVVVQAVLGILGHQVQGHGATLRCLVHMLERVRAFAGRFPARRVIFTGTAGQQRDLVRDHERGVETDAELTDQFFRCRCILGFLELTTYLGGAGLGERADQVDDLVTRHADAVVADREGARRFVDVDLDVQIGDVDVEVFVLVRLEAELVQRVRSVGDQLTKEAVLVRID